MNVVARYVDEFGTAIEVTQEDGDFRFITDADLIPQGKGVWLSRMQVEHLILDLAGGLVTRGKS